MSELATHPCVDKCAWGPTDRQLDGEPVFECDGCHSEWTPDQTWTPRNIDGEISPEVLAVKRPAPAEDEWGF